MASHRTSFVSALFAVALAGCSQPSHAVIYPAAIKASSQTHLVQGQYTPVALESIDGVSIQEGKLMLRGPSGTIAVDPPAGADLAKPTRHWALTTEAAGDDHRTITFTHSQSVEDFSIELPPANAELRFGVFSGPGGGEVMVLAWGTGGRSFWGHVTIKRRA
jgi:hypothetical protein